MRLKQYINDEKEGDNIIDNILKVYDDCKPFLKEFIPAYKKTDEFLYRGTYKINKSPTGFMEVKPRKNRKPMNMSLTSHKFLDEYFKKEFGWKARSEGVFCVGGKLIAEGYGTVNIIFPVGKYRYIWSPDVYDLYIDLSTLIDTFLSLKKELKEIDDPEIKKYKKELYDEYKEKVYNDLSTYQDTDLAGAIMSRSEIMLDCKKYYMFKNKRYNSVFNSLFKKYGSRKPTAKQIFYELAEAKK
jgi:hypothetical protein